MYSTLVKGMSITVTDISTRDEFVLRLESERNVVELVTPASLPMWQSGWVVPQFLVKVGLAGNADRAGPYYATAAHIL